MTQDLLEASLIREINKRVKEPWTEIEEVDGKVITVLWEDIEVVKKVVPLFLEKGWIFAKKQALLETSGRKILLHICRPPFEEIDT